MSEKKSRNSDTRPKTMRSWSADSYVWSSKKRSRASRESESRVWGDDGEGPEEQGARSASCSRRRRDRKCSCSLLADGDLDVPCRKSLPIPAAERKIHVSELMEDKCPFSPRSELAQCWHLIKKHGAHGRPLALGTGAGERKASLAPSSPPALISWEQMSSGSSSQRTHSLDDWDPSCRHGDELHDCCSDTDYILVPDLLQINNSACYWGVLDRFQAEELLEGQPEGTFLLRDSAQDDFLFSVSFRRYSRSLHARIEQNGKRFSFDGRDPCMYQDSSVTGLLRHYSDPATCLFFEPLLSRPLPRTFPFSLQHLCRAVVCSRTTYQGIEALPLPWALRDYLRQYHFKCNGACSV
ncbi:hypothetical protein ACEWY4_027589 [Coilia grayii]|uniref:Suppressor of cytokine signaling 4 n=1 Tax=Coilia grayii TaxID=363190 RepID=A0ABD1IP83_9TELE